MAVVLMAHSCGLGRGCCRSSVFGGITDKWAPLSTRNRPRVCQFVKWRRKPAKSGTPTLLHGICLVDHSCGRATTSRVGGSYGHDRCMLHGTSMLWVTDVWASARWAVVISTTTLNHPLVWSQPKCFLAVIAQTSARRHAMTIAGGVI